MRADLHLHTWCSDGELEPAALLALVRERSLRLFAVADHDCLSGWRACAALGAEGLVPAVEATAGHAGREVHVVGLAVDPEQSDLAALLARNRCLREERLERLLAHLPAGIRGSLTLDDLRDRRPGAGEALGRNHLARALVARGAASSQNAVFDAWLADEHLADGELPAFPGPGETAEVIRAAGGLAILAHPGAYREMPAIEALMACGLDGLESDHPTLAPALARQIADAASSRGWLESQGTDFHFPGRRRPGDCHLHPARFKPLRERIEAILHGRGAIRP